MARRKSPPRTKAPNGSGLQQRIGFCYHPNLNTPEGEVYQYLLRSPIWTVDQGKGMVNDVVLTRWLAYARMDRNPPLAKKTAQHALRQLIRYIDEICRDFELENPVAPRLAMPAMIPQGMSPGMVPATTPATGFSVSTPPVAKPDEGYGRFDLFEEA